MTTDEIDRAIEFLSHPNGSLIAGLAVARAVAEHLHFDAEARWLGFELDGYRPPGNSTAETSLADVLQVPQLHPLVQAIHRYRTLRGVIRVAGDTSQVELPYPQFCAEPIREIEILASRAKANPGGTVLLDIPIEQAISFARESLREIGFRGPSLPVVFSADDFAGILEGTRAQALTFLSQASLARGTSGSAGGAPSTTEVRGRLAEGDQKLNRNRGACPQCQALTLTATHTLLFEHDRVDITWRCTICGYADKLEGAPFKSWTQEAQRTWETSASTRLEGRQAVRCPDCGEISLDSSFVGQSGWGASEQFRIRCKTLGCGFPAIEIDRSIPAVAARSVRRAGLYSVLIVSALLVALLTAGLMSERFRNGVADLLHLSSPPTSVGSTGRTK